MDNLDSDNTYSASEGMNGFGSNCFDLSTALLKVLEIVSNMSTNVRNRSSDTSTCMADDLTSYDLHAFSGSSNE